MSLWKTLSLREIMGTRRLKPVVGTGVVFNKGIE